MYVDLRYLALMSSLKVHFRLAIAVLRQGLADVNSLQQWWPLCT